MATFHYSTKQFLPIDIKQAWDFFSSAGNLALITPPELDFKILTRLDGKEIYEGMLIDYTVKPLLGIPLRWQTEICRVQKLQYFTDRQLRGPYKLWEHTHRYAEVNGGVLMHDEVKYQLPLGFLGNVINSLIVRKKIEDIFSFRTKVLNQLFV